MEGGSQGPQLQLWRGCAGDSRLGTRGFPKVNFQCPVTNMSWLLGPWMALGQCVLQHNTQGGIFKGSSSLGSVLRRPSQQPGQEPVHRALPMTVQTSVSVLNAFCLIYLEMHQQLDGQKGGPTD